MKKIVVASSNQVKINATLQAFEKMFEDQQFSIFGINAKSGVSNQPSTDKETFEGAVNRAKNASEASSADYWVGIEGGIEEKNGEIESFAWIVIKDKKSKIGKARTATFFLPEKISKLIRQGKELGDADDIVFGDKNSKEKGGTVGKLTGDVIDRTKYYREAVILALIPFKNNKLY